VLTGLIRGWRGTVRVLGRDVAAWRPSDYRDVGVGFELPAHFGKLTARENLAFFAALYPGRDCDVDGLLGRLGLTDAAERRVDAFSKGMLTRLTLARALLHRPPLLFLDEPTSGLDPVTARAVRALIRERRDEGATVFLTTHDMVTADELCDRVAFVVDGRVRALDSPRTLRLQAGGRRVRVTARGADGVEVREFPLAGIGEDAGFLALLRGGDVETIHTTEATLEDVFVRVTGRGLT
jgi:fluoroquinolone transport system ATP-binding protein